MIESGDWSAQIRLRREAERAAQVTLGLVETKQGLEKNGIAEPAQPLGLQCLALDLEPFGLAALGKLGADIAVVPTKSSEQFGEVLEARTAHGQPQEVFGVHAVFELRIQQQTAVDQIAAEEGRRRRNVAPVEKKHPEVEASFPLLPQSLARLIHEKTVAENHIRRWMRQGVVTNLLQSARQEVVVRIQPHEPISGGFPESLVDRIRLAFIGLGGPHNIVARLQQVLGFVRGARIDDNVLHLIVPRTLVGHALQTIGQKATLI
jgi:hypothetical protein